MISRGKLQINKDKSAPCSKAMDWGSIKKKSEFIQFAHFYTLRDLETSFQTKLLRRKQS